MNSGIHMTWEAVAAVTGVLVILGGLHALYTRLAIKTGIADLVKELDNRYRAIPVCEERHHDIGRRLETLEQEK